MMSGNGSSGGAKNKRKKFKNFSKTLKFQKSCRYRLDVAKKSRFNAVFFQSRTFLKIKTAIFLRRKGVDE
jgi:hypothetical protein